MELTNAQTATVTIVYLSSLLPLFILLGLRLANKLPNWILAVYIGGFLACAIGWEIWLTYGLIDGLDVNSRRPDALNAAIPIHINWILNSLADASVIGLFGVFLVWLSYGKSDRAFRQWHWGAFFILSVWFIGQNVFVELYIYQLQLAEGLRLSWAPLIPTGPWYNPTLFQFGDKTLQLQTQLPWLLMTPIYYGLLIKLYRVYGEKPAAARV
ncbi:MAG: hypothetical protein V7746_11675 [Halioglobus sp.]